MTSSSLVLVHRILILPIIFLVLLAPVTSSSQEQKQNSTTEKPAEPASSEQGSQVSSEKNEQPPSSEQGSLITPEKNERSASSEQGSLIMPQKDEQSGESMTDQEHASAEGADRIYIIKKADTLWDISSMFLKDPFLWPFIWKVNPYIANPDLIYPGNKIVIPSLAPIEQALTAEVPSGEQSTVPVAKRRLTVPEPDAEEETSSRLILPDEEPVPIMDKYAMLNAGFVNMEESKDKIVDSKEGKTILGYDDIVYVTIRSVENPQIGDKFIIYMPMNKVKHPVTRKNYGNLIKVLGILELLEKSTARNFTARISLSFDAAVKGSLLTPYQEPALIYNQAQEKAKDISGYILEVTDTRTINGQADIVYLDKGSAQGVDPGDRFIIYNRPHKGAFPRNVIGEAQVFLVKEHTSTAVVRKSTNTMTRGDMVEFKK